jgi:hypothetical protein
VVVDALQVQPQVNTLPVRLAASAARVRTFAGVRFLVRLQVTKL